jgi:hypothetical protein
MLQKREQAPKWGSNEEEKKSANIFLPSVKVKDMWSYNFNPYTSEYVEL